MVIEGYGDLTKVYTLPDRMASLTVRDRILFRSRRRRPQAYLPGKRRMV
jgi:hypothetical protein